MALARIITRFPEEAHELVESLRSRGFEVQTESPGKTSPQPADLEITIEECDAEEALQRATSVQDACAFVMPGAITGGVQPITAIRKSRVFLVIALVWRPRALKRPNLALRP